MKLLVFEFICGGGLAGQPLPSGLQREGALMLQALLRELKALPDIELVLPLDSRLRNWGLSAEYQVHWIDNSQSMSQWLPALLAEVDAFWPVAPETDGLLQGLVEWGMLAGVTMLASTPDAIALTADKWLCYQALQTAGLPCVPTRLLSDASPHDGSAKVIKPRDGVSCAESWLGEDPQTVQQRFSPSQNYILQPYCSGAALSLSALFNDGQAWLLSVNRQLISIEQDGFILQGCQVNIPNEIKLVFSVLLNNIAQAIPGLFGYIGIDLIDTEQGPQLLEINPRLTTSYSALYEATGLNVAQQVLRLAEQQLPLLTTTRNQTLTIQLS